MAVSENIVDKDEITMLLCQRLNEVFIVVGTGEHVQEHPEICSVSLEAARAVTDPLIEELGDPNSVLHAVMAHRKAAMSPLQRVEASTALLSADPLRVGSIVPRYRVQGGELPADSAQTVDQALALWVARSGEKFPRLVVPEGYDQDVMEVADKVQMRGGGSIIYAREEVGKAFVGDSLVVISGGARNAMRERIETAIRLNPEGRIVGTADPGRLLLTDEMDAVKDFAPNARNEYELFIDSAKYHGFELKSNGYGAHHLPDGSSFVLMVNPQTDTEMVVLAPAKQGDDDGKPETGLFNSYQALVRHGETITGKPGFQLDGSNIVQDTSSHYGLMATLNNLDAVHKLRIHLKSFRVVGDNQPKRTAGAHLIEFGWALDKMQRMTNKSPHIKQALLPMLEEQS